MLRPSERIALGVLLCPLLSRRKHHYSVWITVWWTRGGIMYNEWRGDRGRATGRCFMFNQHWPFSCLHCPLLPPPFCSFSFPFTSEIHGLEGLESHRGVIRVCCSVLSPPLQASQTGERWSSLILCTDWGFAQTHYDPASCFVRGGGRVGLCSSLKMQPG